MSTQNASRPPRLDHGVLNIPLSKRGNINAQLDAYKAAQAKAAKQLRKSKAVEHRAEQSKARALVDSMTADALESLAKRLNKTASQVKKSLLADAYFTPKNIILAFAQGGAA